MLFRLPTALLLLVAVHGPHDGPHSHHPAPQAATWTRPTPSAEPVFVGAGAHRYRWESTWLELPEGREWLGATHGCITTDAAGRVYLSAEQGAAVLVFEPDGRFVRQFGEDWGAGVHGLAIVGGPPAGAAPSTGARPGAPDEVLYVVHTARREVLVTTLEGEVLRRFAPTEAFAELYPEPADYRPTSVAVAPDGTVFVADGYGRSWIHRYAADGTYLSSFGGAGSLPHQLRTPHGLWIDASGEAPELLVADREKHRIARFSLAGEYLGATDAESGLLRRPCHLQFTGELGVVADLAGRVTLLDRELALVAQLGDNPVEEERARFDVPPDRWREGAFCAPHCARIAADGSIYVMDWNVAGRVTRLVPAPE